MKSLISFLLLLASFVSSAQGYLVTKNHDTVRLNHAIEVDGNKSWHWREITYDSISYRIADIMMLQLDGNEYHVIQNKLWKKVISGKINVFALSDNDTITTRKGKPNHSFYMQAASSDRYQPLRIGALAKYSTKINLHDIHRATGNRIVRKSLTIVGITTTAIGALVTFTGLLQQVLGETQESKRLLIGGLSTTELGTGLVNTGIKLEKQDPTISLLDYVRLINAE